VDNGSTLTSGVAHRVGWVYVSEHVSLHPIGKATPGESWSPTGRGKADRPG